MYNFALAFVICAVAYVIGEVVSTLTKAWVPSVFVTAVVFIIGYWYIWPTSLITDAALIPFGSTTGIYLILAITVAVMMILVDVVYSLIDPRIKYD